MFRLANSQNTPPGEWRYTLSEPSQKFHAQTKAALVEKIHAFCKANGVTVPRNLDAEIEDQICRENHGFQCDDEGAKLSAWATFQSLLSGLTVLAPWVADGRPMVSQELADTRGSVCVGCSYNLQPEGCAPCASAYILRRVADLIGAAKAKDHDKLQACGICGCNLRAKVWVPTEYLKKAKLFDVEQLPEWCHFKKELL